jgi:hypothetical protein
MRKTNWQKKMKKMEKKIRALLNKLKAASQEPQSHWLLPHVIPGLEALLEHLSDPKALVEEVGGLGRVILDDYTFSESPLGGELLDLCHEIREAIGYDPIRKEFRKPGGNA